MAGLDARYYGAGENLTERGLRDDVERRQDVLSCDVQEIGPGVEGDLLGLAEFCMSLAVLAVVHRRDF